MKTYPYMKLQYDLAPTSLCSKTQPCICVIDGYPKKTSCRSNPDFTHVACAQCAETHIGFCTVNTNFDLSKELRGGDSICLDDSIHGVSSVSPTSIVLVPPCPHKESLHARVAVKFTGLAILKDDQDREIGLSARDEWDNLHFDRQTNIPAVRGQNRLVGVRTVPTEAVKESIIVPRSSENSPFARPLHPNEALDHVPKSPPLPTTPPPIAMVQLPTAESSSPISMVEVETNTLTRVEAMMVARVRRCWSAMCWSAHCSLYLSLSLSLCLSACVFGQNIILTQS